MAALTVNQISLAGLVDPTPEAAAALGDTFVNNGRTYLRVTNAAVSDITVTVDSLVACDQGTDHDIEVVVNNQTKLIGPFSMNRFNNSAGLASVGYSNHATITVAAISL